MAFEVELPSSSPTAAAAAQLNALASCPPSTLRSQFSGRVHKLAAAATLPPAKLGVGEEAAKQQVQGSSQH